MLPQVLAGLGLFSLVSAGCLYWLERLQPLFLTLSVGALVYQVWAVSTRPPFLRTRGIKLILYSSLAINLTVLGGWVFLWLRYR
ncbi:MAG TPA: hypothetical protein VNN17_00235 [Terriglobia bacterium]|nr:hypothetical protein [Terriglobia bacterium]